MSVLRALIVGVSDYSAMKEQNLPFCKNDIYAIKSAFVSGLKVNPANIIVCGTTGSVLIAELISSLQLLSSSAKKDDTLLLYFSGHGSTVMGSHYLILSDEEVETQKLISYIEMIPARNKILFLDCCMAGNFTVNDTAVFDINETANQFAGKGYAVIASSNATQYSYGHPDKPISLFTNFLCEALTFASIIREGKKSLYNINQLLFLFLEIWNKNNPDKKQNPIYRANMGGTIFFEVQEYYPYPVGKFFEENENYIIYSVKPNHNGIAKRYSVQVILKQPFSFEEISFINHEIVEKVKPLDIYNNERQQRHWQRTRASLVFSCFALDETDVINNNYICNTTWADDTQDRGNWYYSGKHCEVINGIHFNINLCYQEHKVSIIAHTGTKEKLVEETREIMSYMITLAEQAISKYNEFLNGVLSEKELVDNMTSIIPQIEKLYLAQGDLDISPNELKDWCQCYTGLAASIHEFTLFYNSEYLPSRSPENRKACMDDSVEQYYKELEKFKKMDINI